jgi:RNA polymerase sigma-70 factor, ECF subfamily
MAVSETDWLGQRFEENRSHLRSVAYRMLGSFVEADDAVQEAWLKLSRSDSESIDNLRAWLTTVVGRVCLDRLESRSSRREESLDAPELQASAASLEHDDNPESEVLLADSLGHALLIMLGTLQPIERVTFVLHDIFEVPFDDIAVIVKKSSDATRQIASRARRRIRGASVDHKASIVHRQKIVSAFLAAARDGDMDSLLSLLDPDAVIRADSAAVQLGGIREILGAQAVANKFKNRATAAQPAVLDGNAGLVWAPGGQPKVAFCFTIDRDKITCIELIADRESIRQLNVTIPQDPAKQD